MPRERNPSGSNGSVEYSTNSTLLQSSHYHFIILVSASFLMDLRDGWESKSSVAKKRSRVRQIKFSLLSGEAAWLCGGILKDMKEAYQEEVELA